MSILIIAIIAYLLLFVVNVIIIIVNFINGENKSVLILVLSIIAHFFILVISIFILDIPEPQINREDDYSAIVIQADRPFKTLYYLSKPGSKSEWHQYKHPIIIEEDCIVYAMNSFLFFKSETVNREVSVAENGLVYFGVEKPRTSISCINVKYNYKDADYNGNSGNHYAGYILNKSDFSVKGIDLEC